MKIPTEWLSPHVGLAPMEPPKTEATPTPSVPKGFVVVEKERVPRKLHVPQLKTFKRIIAAFLLLFNFTFAQGMIGAGSFSSVMYVFFMANTFILLDYLWKSRRRTY